MGVKVEVRNLSFSFGSIKALRGVSLDAYEGQVTCLLGPNGSGKTTLLKCVMGLLSPYDGSIRVGGREVSEMDRREAARLMAYVPQIHRAVFPFSSLSVVLLGRTPWISEISGPGEEDIRRAEEVMEELGISHLAHRPYTRLSGGEMRMVLIARALVQEAPVLLMDEPTAYLDFRYQSIVMDVVRRLADSGKTVLLSLHDPNVAAAYCDRIYVLDRGTVAGVLEGSLDKGILERVYGMELAQGSVDGRTFIFPRRGASRSSHRGGS